VKPSVLDLTRPELEAKLSGLGQKPSHAAAVFSAIYKAGASSFEDMAGVPPKVRAALAGAFSLPSRPVPDKKVSRRDGTVKLLLKFRGGAPAECVVIPGKGRLSACLSSQSGCACGCSFCATGEMGLKRDLSAWEITAQFSACLKEAGGALSSLVFMGMGEPFLNWDNVKKAIQILSDGRGHHFPQSKMTVSTVGIVPVIDELAASELKVKLAVSVVAADPALRARLVPMEKKYPLGAVLASVRNYCRARRAQVFFEYILFKGVNDGPADAEKLLALISGIPCRVNLIPHNPPGAPAAPASAGAKEFQARLIAGGVRTYLRLEKGSDISAACGQLASGIVKI
jgi:23S rRNA (adenine2503-C2)-methyltransferase